MLVNISTFCLVTLIQCSLVLADRKSYRYRFRRLEEEEDDDEEDFGVEVEYEHVYDAMVFLTATYLAGIALSKFLKMPALVGEIFAGIILGPELLDYVPYEESFVLLGEIGLIFLVLEAGIDIDLVTLKLVGSRGCVIAIFGTILPFIIAFSIALLMGHDWKESIATGICFGPTSLGIALNILRAGNVLNTPTGQMIIAAAIIDDMIALVLLSQLSALEDDITVALLIVPIISGLAFLFIGGYLAIYVLPRYVEKIQQKFPPKYHGYVSTILLFGFLYALLPATYYSNASYLMGAFLSGLVFCSDRELHHNFVKQFKRVMQWLIRIFFAASIGFQIPIKDFEDGEIIYKGILFTLALLGKLAVGFLVPNFSQSEDFKGSHFRDCLIVGFSMMAEAEFALVVALHCINEDVIDQSLYSSIVLAILLSTVIAPFSLRYTINKYSARGKLSMSISGNDKLKELEAEIKSLTSEKEQIPLFLHIRVDSIATWGLFGFLLRSIQELKLDVIDHRTFHPHGDEFLSNEVYAKDNEMSIDLHNIEAVNNRLREIREKLCNDLDQENTTVEVTQWTMQSDPFNEEIGSENIAGDIYGLSDTLPGAMTRPLLVKKDAAWYMSDSSGT